ncbi:glycosyltransferase family protein [Yunchengibacter salinarum]|uniref:glycosyltransferase family protein n=1 Tax=Yunchengibacter salinarum TaxID=3133399 RepID=UPI0035B645C1
MTRRVLICGNPDLNCIDGSSIWAQTIALATAATGSAKVDFLAKSTPARDELYAPLKINADITLVDGSDRKHWQGKGFARITLAMMGELAIRLDREKPYDVIIVRGLEIASQLLDAPDVLAKCWMYLTDIPQALSDYAPDERLVMQRIAMGCQRLLCQTAGFKTLWQALVPDLDTDKVRLYTPVIPDLPERLAPISERPLQAIYAGKFKGDWMTLEMAEAWPFIHRELPGSELVMIGDKIHDVPEERAGYKQEMQKALEGNAGLRWLGAQPRKAVQRLLQQARVGLSWRHESMNDTVEYSTKILEYGGAGCAAILNRNSLHEQLLGQDYPLYANSDADFRRQLTRALREPKVAQQAADALKRLAERHTFSTRVGEIRQWLKEAPKAPEHKSKTRVLVAGHNLKFFTLLQKKLEATRQFEFLTDQWQGHNEHYEAKSRALLEQADVIFCEWCLGNLKWYSHNKQPHQRLVARFHLQERELPYVAEANWDNIDHISYVSEFIRREGQKASGFPFEKTSVIPNLLDESKFTLKKKTGDARYTLGIIGAAPARKRLDRAIDLLEALLEEDDRYCLRVKGKHPLDYDWLLKREDELAYYRKVFERINSNPRLQHKVIFDPPGDDVNDWFTMVGFILSPSDFESFHMAIGEGMLTGARPIIWDWDGAAEIWGEKYIIRDGAEAKEAVLSHIPSKEMNNQFIVQSFLYGVIHAWQKIIWNI